MQRCFHATPKRASIPDTPLHLQFTRRTVLRGGVAEPDHDLVRTWQGDCFVSGEWPSACGTGESKFICFTVSPTEEKKGRNEGERGQCADRSRKCISAVLEGRGCDRKKPTGMLRTKENPLPRAGHTGLLSILSNNQHCVGPLGFQITVRFERE